MKDTAASRWMIALALGAVYLIWGSTYLAIRVGVHELPPFLMAGTRYFLAGIPLLIWARSRGNPAPTLQEWKSAAILGLLLMVGGNGMVSLAEKTVESATAALLITTVPLWMVMLDATVYRRRRLPLPVWLGLFLGFLGVVVLLRPTGEDLSSVPLAGGGLLLFAAFSWANGSLLSRRLPLPNSIAMVTAMEMTCGGAMLLLIGLFRGETNGFDPSTVSNGAWIAVVYLLVFGSLVALSAYSWLLQVTAAPVVATYAFVNPVVAVILGSVFLDEKLGPSTLLAGALVISAVILLQAFGRERPKIPNPAAE